MISDADDNDRKDTRRALQSSFERNERGTKFEFCTGFGLEVDWNSFTFQLQLQLLLLQLANSLATLGLRTPTLADPFAGEGPKNRMRHLLLDIAIPNLPNVCRRSQQEQEEGATSGR